MSISADFHLHTNFSTDSKTPMEEMITSGMKKGLKTMCFTEHMDYDYPIPSDDPTFDFLVDMDAYLSKTKELAEKHSGKCEILFLDADSQVLVKRYKESRRNHPLSNGSVLEGIEIISYLNSR